MMLYMYMVTCPMLLPSLSMDGHRYHIYIYYITIILSDTCIYLHSLIIIYFVNMYLFMIIILFINLSKTLNTINYKT